MLWIFFTGTSSSLTNSNSATSCYPRVLWDATSGSFSKVLLSASKSFYIFFSVNTTSLCLKIFWFSESQNRQPYSLVSYPMRMYLLDFGSNLLLWFRSTWTYEYNQKYAGDSALPLCRSLLPLVSHSSRASMSLCWSDTPPYWLHLLKIAWAI